MLHLLLAVLGLNAWVEAAPVPGLGMNWENVASVEGIITDANPIPAYYIRDNMQWSVDLQIDWSQSESFSSYHAFFGLGGSVMLDSDFVGPYCFPCVGFGIYGGGTEGYTLRFSVTNDDNPYAPYNVYSGSYGFPLTPAPAPATGVVTYAMQVTLTQTDFEMYVDGLPIFHHADFAYHDLLSSPVAMHQGPQPGHSWANAANFQLFYATPTLVPGIASFVVGAQAAVVPTAVAALSVPTGYAAAFFMTDSYVIEFDYTITYAAVPGVFDDACLLCSYPLNFDFRCANTDTGGKTWTTKRMISCGFGVGTDPLVTPVYTMVHQNEDLLAPTTVTHTMKLAVTQSSYQFMSDGYLVHEDLNYPAHNAAEELLLYFGAFDWISFANFKVMAATPDPSLGIAWTKRVEVLGAVTAIEPFYICDNMKIEFDLSFDGAAFVESDDIYLTDNDDYQFFIRFLGGWLSVFYPNTGSAFAPMGGNIEGRFFIQSLAGQPHFEILVTQDAYAVKVDGEYKLFFAIPGHAVDNTPLTKTVLDTPAVTLGNFTYYSDCAGGTPNPSAFPTAAPTPQPTDEPTEAGCAVQGTLVHPNWQALLDWDGSYTDIEAIALEPAGDASVLSSNAVLNSGYMYVDPAAVTLTIDVVLPYIGHGIAKPETETQYEYGNAYVLDFSPFESSSVLRWPGSCSNRLPATFFALPDGPAFWSFMDPPTSATLGTQSGGAAYGAMPPFWRLSLVDELRPCTAGIRYTGTFSFAELQNCVDYASLTHQMAVATSDSWVNLSGVFNLDLVGTFYKLSEQRNAPQRIRTLLSQPFTLAIERNIYYLASTGVQTFREAVIGVTIKDEKLVIVVTLTLLSETADYLQLAPVDSVIVVNGVSYAYTVYAFQDGACLDAEANVCYQQWGVRITIPKPGAVASAPAPVPAPVAPPVFVYDPYMYDYDPCMYYDPGMYDPCYNYYDYWYTQMADQCLMVDPDPAAFSMCMCVQPDPTFCAGPRRLLVVPTQSHCQTVNISGDYVIEFNVSCNPAGDQSVCEAFLAVQENLKIYISTTLKFFYSTCAPLIWEMAFQSQVLFYTALDFATPMGADDVYEVLLPVFGKAQVLLPGAELLSLFGVHLMNMWICTVDEDAYDPSTFVLTPAEQRDGHGGCLSDLVATPMIDTGTVYHIFDALNPSENLFAADTLGVANAAPNEVYFTFNVPDLQNGNNRDLLFVHLQMQLDLLSVADTPMKPRRRLLSREHEHEHEHEHEYDNDEDDNDNDDSVSNQLYHFLVPMNIRDPRDENGQADNDVNDVSDVTDIVHALASAESPVAAALFSWSTVTVLSVVVFISVAANLAFCVYVKCGCGCGRKGEQKYAGIRNFGSSDESSGVSSNEMTETDDYDDSSSANHNREDEQGQEQEQEREALHVRVK